MTLSNYKYLSKLNGIALVDIILGNTRIDRLDTNFIVDLKEQQFDFSVEGINSNLWDSVDDYYWRKDNLHADKLDYIYCIDSNNIPFTVYDCIICPLNIPLKTIRIVWNEIVIGQHISDKNSCLVNKMQCVVEDVKKHYRLSVGKHEYAIESGTINVKTDWSRLLDEENNRIIFNGTLFELTSKALIPFAKMKEAFYRLLEMYSLWIGYFPEINDMRFNNDLDEFIYATHHNVHFSANRNVRLDRRLFPHDKHNKNFSTQYDKWVAIRGENIPVSTLFENTLNGRDIIHEVRTSILIQCLEGYFDTRHKDKLVEKIPAKFEKRTKTSISKVVADLLKRDSGHETLFKEFCDKIKENEKKLPLKEREFTLEETINFAIEYTPYTQKVFDYERNNKISENQTQLDEFVQKAVKHRNFISHLFVTDNYFKGEENDLAQKKIELLLRLCFLYDIGLEITEESLDNYIKTIEREFYRDTKNMVLNT